MTTIKGTIKIERFCGDPNFVRMIEDFYFYSNILCRWCCIPAGFIYDEESEPIVKGSNPESGAIHDYLCRIDSDPVVDKETAAKVYKEFQAFYDEKETGNILNRFWDWLARSFKTEVVEIAPGYFHRHLVLATYEEIKGE